MCECKYCGKPFERTHASQKYCSTECSTIANRERTNKNRKKYQKSKETEKVCPYCGKTFIQVGSFRKYCSQECSDAMNKDRTKPADVEPKKKRRKKPTSLRVIAKEARKHGMTYGQYVAQMEIRKGVID
jgi:predicted nucleic acid-binding Zn ribbon protein